MGRLIYFLDRLIVGTFRFIRDVIVLYYYCLIFLVKYSAHIFFLFCNIGVVFLYYEWDKHGRSWQGIFNAVIDHIGYAMARSPFFRHLF